MSRSCSNRRSATSPTGATPRFSVRSCEYSCKQNPRQGGSESIRRIADRLDRFAAELVATATVLEDEELTVISEQARPRQFVPEPSVPRQLPRIARFGPKVHARIDRELVDRCELLIGEGRLFESADALGDLLPPAGADQRRGDHIVAKHP